MKTHSNFAARIFGILAIAATVGWLQPTAAYGQTAEGTDIINTATVSFSDANSNAYSTVDGVATVTVGHVAGIDVVAGAATATPLVNSTGNTMTFTVNNVGNGVDTLSVSQTNSDPSVLTVTQFTYNSTNYANIGLPNTALADSTVVAGGSVVITVEYFIADDTGGEPSTYELTGTSIRDGSATDPDNTVVTPSLTGSVVTLPDGAQTLSHLPNSGTVPTYTFTFTVDNQQTGQDDFDLLVTKTGSGAITIVSVNAFAGDSTQVTHVRPPRRPFSAEPRMSSSISSVTTLLLSFALLFAAASSAQAQVTIESVVWDWDVGASSLDITAVNTSVGSNRALLVAVCLNNNDGQLPVSVVLDPVGASPDTLDWLDVGDPASSWSDADDGHCTIWGVKSPLSGTSLTVRVTLDSATQSDEGLNVGVWSLSDVDQTTPFRDAVDVDDGTGTDAASITVPSQSGDLVFGAAFNEWYNSNTRMAVSGTGIEDFDIPGVDSEDKTVGQHKTATGTSTTLTWTNDNDPSPKWAVIGVAVIPAPASGSSLLGSWVTGTTHTAEAGSNRALILVSTRTGWDDSGETITSVTYGGQALVHVERGEEDSSSTGYFTQTEVWILDEAGIAAASNSTFVVNWSR